MTGKAITVTLNPSIDRTIVVPALVPFALNRVEQARLDPGGKGINVARVLKSFGAETVVTGFLAGGTGRQLRSFLKGAGLPSDLLDIPGETRTNIKIFDKSARRTTEINENGCTVSPADLARFLQKFRVLCTGTDVAVLSGSLPPGVPDDTYATLIRLAKEAGVRTILDADGEALRFGIESLPTAVKPNIHELETLTGRPLSTPEEVLAAARSLIRRGIGIVIVSMGPDGAVVADAREAYRVESWNIPVKSATGAGDSMVGALADALLRGASLADIARVTTAAGTITASKPGTQLCEKDEVTASLGLVTVRPMK